MLIFGVVTKAYKSDRGTNILQSGPRGPRDPKGPRGPLLRGPELSKFMQNVDFFGVMKMHIKVTGAPTYFSQAPGAPTYFSQAPEAPEAPEALVTTLVDFPLIFPYFPFFSIYGFWQPGAPRALVP